MIFLVQEGRFGDLCLPFSRFIAAPACFPDSFTFLAPPRSKNSHMNFRAKVLVLASDCDRIVFEAHADEIKTLFARKACKIESKDKAGHIAVVKLLATARTIETRPGSFGILQRHVPVGNQYGLSGGIIFEHHGIGQLRAA
jgi:hypothetical protein